MPIAELHALFTSPVSYALLALSALLIGMSKMGFPGINIISTPIVIYLVQDVRVSIALALLLLYPGDIVAVLHFRKSCNKKVFFMFTPYAIVGVLAAGFIGVFLSRTTLLALIVFLILAFALIMIIQEIHYLVRRRKNAARIHGEEAHRAPKPQSLGRSMILGLLVFSSGASSTLASASGPITSLYLLTLRMDKKSFIGTGAVLYITYNTVKLFIFTLMWKVISVPLLLYSLTVTPWAIAGAYLSRSISKNIPEHVYRWVIIALVCAAGFSLMRLL